MEEKIINEETEEIENVDINIPEELEKYLKEDTSAFEKFDSTIADLEDSIKSLNEERERTKADFEKRLNEFKEQLDKEKEEIMSDYAEKEEDLVEEKTRVESIKVEEQGNQVNYIDSLKAILDKYNKKMDSITSAIQTCKDNDTLTQALEEEKDKLEKDLDAEYDERKKELEDVLESIGIEPEPVTPTYTIDPDTEINLDFRTPEEIEREMLLDKESKETSRDFDIDLTNSNFNLMDDNEVIEHESRKDVISEIYQSKEIMEEHVFKYLKGLRGE